MAVKTKTQTVKQQVTKATAKKAPVTVATKSAAKVVAKPAPSKPAAANVVSAKIAPGKPAAGKVMPSAAVTAKTVAAKTAPAKTTAAKAVTPAARKPEAIVTAAAGKASAAVSSAALAAVKQAAAKVQAVRAAIAASPVVARPAAAPARTVPAALAKSGAAKLSAPVAPPASPKVLAERAAAAQQALAAQKKNVNQRHGFKTNEFIVYPAHGVGRIVGIEEQEIAGMSLELFVINFEKEKLTLRVPTGKLESVGMRKLAGEEIVRRAMDTLKGRARVKRTMWSRRAQEYVAKINSGDLISIAEVVRDLYRSEAQPEQSYSERQLYEDALDRMAREIAVVDKLDDRGAVQRITDVLSKSARGRRLAEDGVAADADVKAA